jgi:hypothetical protein
MLHRENPEKSQKVHRGFSLCTLSFICTALCNNFNIFDSALLLYGPIWKIKKLNLCLPETRNICRC